MKIVNTLSQHLQTPDESLETYLRRKQLELARDIRTAKKIYLDTKFWILLREARLRKAGEPDILRLLEILEAGAARGTVVCPISADTYIEVLLQSDPVTRGATIELIDDLSNGVAMIEIRERISLEALHFATRYTKGVDAVYPVEELIWTKIAYVLGFVRPYMKSLPQELDCAVQKAFLDQLWAMTATDMLDLIGRHNRPFTTRYPDISDELNRGKVEHHHENRSFKQLFLSELWGLLDLYKPCFAEVVAFVYEKDTGQHAARDAHAMHDGGRMFANLIYHGFRLNKLTKQLPSLWLGAGFHAAVRWDLTRKFKANDLPDFRHAVAAIPYCDIFLTEHSLRHLVSDKNLRLESLFPCRTFSEPSQAAEAIESLVV